MAKKLPKGSVHTGMKMGEVYLSQIGQKCPIINVPNRTKKKGEVVDEY